MNILVAATTVAAGSSFTVREASASVIATFWGTWGTGGSVRLEHSPDGGTTWLVIGSAATANGQQTVALPAGLVRANVTAGSGHSINVDIDNVRVD